MGSSKLSSNWRQQMQLPRESKKQDSLVLPITLLNIYRFYPPTRSIARYTATWLGGWLAVCHSRYCVLTTKPILKLFRPPGEFELFVTPLHRYPVPRRTRSAGALNIRGGKIAVYLGNSAR